MLMALKELKRGKMGIFKIWSASNTFAMRKVGENVEHLVFSVKMNGVN
jgi:hypothetical protein